MPERGRPDREFYESLIESSPLVVVRLAGDDQTVRYISPNCSRLFGWSPETIQSRGWSWLEVVHPGDVDTVRDAFLGFLANTSRPMTAYFRIRTVEGRSRWTVCRFRKDPEFSGDLFGFILDIHDRVVADAEANRQRDLLQSVLDHASVSIQVKDLEGRFLIANRRIYDDLGLEPGSLIGKTPHEVWPPQLADSYVANDRAAVEAGEPVTSEEVAEHPDGTHTYVSIKFPLRDAEGEIFAVGGVSTDITDRRGADDALRAAKEEAEEADRAKTELLSRLSQELRSPADAILGFAQVLEGDDLSASQAKAVTQISEQGRHLLDLIGEILDVPGIEP